MANFLKTTQRQSNNAKDTFILTSEFSLLPTTQKACFVFFYPIKKFYDCTD